MWLYTQHGSASIVYKRDVALVRSRRKTDIEYFARLNPGEVEIQHTPERDYPYRFFTSREDLMTLFAALAADIDYPNFKERALRTVPESLSVLHAVYNATLKL